MDFWVSIEDMLHRYVHTSQTVLFGGLYIMYSRVSKNCATRRVLLRILILLYFADKLGIILPENISHLFIQCMAGTLSGFATTVITNPLDTIRARLQVCFFCQSFYSLTV